MENFDGTKDWEKSVIIYCLINAVCLKNKLFNENVLKGYREKKPPAGLQKKNPNLKRVK